MYITMQISELRFQKQVAFGTYILLVRFRVDMEARRPTPDLDTTCARKGGASFRTEMTRPREEHARVMHTSEIGPPTSMTNNDMSSIAISEAKEQSDSSLRIPHGAWDAVCETYARQCPTQRDWSQETEDPQEMPGKPSQMESKIGKLESRVDFLENENKELRKGVENMSNKQGDLQKVVEKMLAKQGDTECTVRFLQDVVKSLKEERDAKPRVEHIYDPDKVYFHGETDILSNFYACTIHFDNWDFGSAEHLYQYCKALFHKDFDKADDISKARNAVIAKRVSKKINVCQKWHEHKFEVMKKILRVKSDQCKEFRERLLETGQRPLIHDLPDPVWGWGVTGSGQNKNGKLLEELRSELSESKNLSSAAIKELLEEFPFPSEEESVSKQRIEENWRDPVRNRIGFTENTTVQKQHNTGPWSTQNHQKDNLNFRPPKSSCRSPEVQEFPHPAPQTFADTEGEGIGKARDEGIQTVETNTSCPSNGKKDISEVIHIPEKPKDRMARESSQDTTFQNEEKTRSPSQMESRRRAARTPHLYWSSQGYKVNKQGQNLRPPAYTDSSPKIQESHQPAPQTFANSDGESFGKEKDDGFQTVETATTCTPTREPDAHEVVNLPENPKGGMEGESSQDRTFQKEQRTRFSQKKDAPRCVVKMQQFNRNSEENQSWHGTRSRNRFEVLGEMASADSQKSRKSKDKRNKVPPRVTREGNSTSSQHQRAHPHQESDPDWPSVEESFKMGKRQ